MASLPSMLATLMALVYVGVIVLVARRKYRELRQQPPTPGAQVDLWSERGVRTFTQHRAWRFVLALPTIFLVLGISGLVRFGFQAPSDISMFERAMLVTAAVSCIVTGVVCLYLMKHNDLRLTWVAFFGALFILLFIGHSPYALFALFIIGGSSITAVFLSRGNLAQLADLRWILPGLILCLTAVAIGWVVSGHWYGAFYVAVGPGDAMFTGR